MSIEIIISQLIGDALLAKPAERPSASVIAQRFLDKYNDWNLAERNSTLSDLVFKVRDMIHERQEP